MIDRKTMEYIKNSGGNINILTIKEIKTIEKFNRLGKLNYIEFNKKGHLIVEQRYPYIPLYVSVLSLIISLVFYGFIFANMWNE